MSATVVATALNSAVEADADPQSQGGVYAIEGGAEGYFIVVAPHCVTNGCTAEITSNRGFDGPAVLNNGRWDFKISKPDGVVCDDGSYAPVVVDYSVDAVSLEGVLTADSNGNCPGGQVTQAPFRLRKVSDS
ncbi:hypothetical protein MU0083_000274 [[Mycobacterium] kokjensenii]|uniref:Secreted protein n=1 Tax=[Mycobacterium] kokjensenii TaxID=3064287 RepID=A0ABM9L6P8_9MYCO|nr:hypothetical protein [Mycolicibacter sp. MU0083]CAJ1493351.1 hypothetical protein MU0083_000274 [Mycolicibacter sp. MU0083]